PPGRRGLSDEDRGLARGSHRACARRICVRTDRPPFARSYAGTWTGTLAANGRVDTWRVEGLTFTLQSARFARGRWGGTYLVTGGRVAFSSSGGSCTAKGSFSLGHLSWDAASISFLQ